MATQILHPYAPPAASSERSHVSPLTWARRHFVLTAILLSALPLLWPAVPPLIDLPNHMSRYRIGLDYATSPYFHRWFDFHWTLVGNLGVDLLVAAIAPLIGLELATKLIVLAIPIMTVAGLALIAREVHGRVPLTAAFGFIFAFNLPFNFGFVNFTLAAALALLTFGLWLRLGRLGYQWGRAALLLPVGFAVWVAHIAGWGLLGLMILSGRFVERRLEGDDWLRASYRAILACLPLTTVLVPILGWYHGGMAADGVTFGYDPARKIALLFLALKNDSKWMDVGAMAVFWTALIVAIAHKGFEFEPRLKAAAILSIVVFLAMPSQFLGSNYADMRLAPYALALTAIAFRPISSSREAKILGALAVALLVGRTALQSYTYWRLDGVYSRQLAALDHVPLGARVFGFARTECFSDWQSDRLDHVNRMAIVRRQGFANDTWLPATSQTLSVRPAMLAGYDDLNSQKYLRSECRFLSNQSMTGSLTRLPKDRFDYYWLIGVSPNKWPHRTWLQPVWQTEDGVLYRILR